jgi:hypothetical protein
LYIRTPAGQLGLSIAGGAEDNQLGMIENISDDAILVSSTDGAVNVGDQLLVGTMSF